jgi:DNA-binding YbaB/EbfC family protein
VNVAKMMKDLQRMQAEIQSRLETLDVEGSAGGGVVTARMNGKKEVLSVRIAPEAFTAGDADLLGDLVVAAINEAGRKVDEEMQQLTQGFAGAKIPGLF